jgi:hypothetical protein
MRVGGDISVTKPFMDFWRFGLTIERIGPLVAAVARSASTFKPFKLTEDAERPNVRCGEPIGFRPVFYT